MRKPDEITVETLIKRNRALRLEYNSPLVKWYQVKLTKRQRYEMGLMSYEEYQEWQEELAAREAAANEQEQTESEPVADDETYQISYDESRFEQQEPVNHTFWEGEEADRENVSQGSYEQFLQENGIDVSNKNSVDIEKLMEDTATEDQ